VYASKQPVRFTRAKLLIQSAAHYVLSAHAMMFRTTAVLLGFGVFISAETASMDNQEVIRLVKQGVHDDEVIRLIQTAPSVGFVLTPDAEQQMMQAGVSENEIKAMAARESGSTTPLAAAANPPNITQPATLSNSSKWTTDFFAGYSYLNGDVGSGDSQSFNGWEVSTASTGPNRHFSVEFDGSGYYTHSFGGLSASDYGFLAGPRANFGPAFTHALFGCSLLGSGAGAASADVSFANAVGGGFQSKPYAGGRFALRVSADYVMTRHFGVSQNNLRVSSGIVFLFKPQSGF
jgi:hypothetical protein